MPSSSLKEGKVIAEHQTLRKINFLQGSQWGSKLDSPQKILKHGASEKVKVFVWCNMA
jgi:hypothetical protein